MRESACECVGCVCRGTGVCAPECEDTHDGDGRPFGASPLSEYLLHPVLAEGPAKSVLLYALICR